jgi:apolipoprotein N-acyltransferase
MGDLLLLGCAIALGFLLAGAFYESLSTRDVLIRRTMRLTRQISSRRWFVGAGYLATVGIGIPLLVLIWTLILETALVFVGSVDRLGNVAVIAVAIVAAARILAYVREKTSHGLAKAIPLALAFALLTGGFLRFEENLTKIVERPEGQALTGEMIAFLVVLEVGLRLLTDTSHAVLGATRRRRGIDSDIGVWRTLGAAIRRPRPPALVDEGASS